MATVLFSYSHKDESLRNRLETHLSLMKREGAIDIWHDRRLVAGDEFDGRIGEELERADIILLLVSPDFIASNYCFDVEMKRAMERHESGAARVIPVILRPCDWHSAPFGKLLAAPKDGKPVVSWPDLDEAFLDVVREIRTALPKDSGKPFLPQRPNASPTPDRPRSSNMRLKESFAEVDRDRYLDDAFAYLANFFESSLDELRKRHKNIDTKFRRIDANRFTATIYRNGKAVSKCSIVLGGMVVKGISYSYDDNPNNGSFNELLGVNSDDQALYLKALGMATHTRDSERHLTFEGAAEYYWSLLIEPLQR
jgi:TIR domain-containing protein